MVRLKWQHTDACARGTVGGGGGGGGGGGFWGLASPSPRIMFLRWPLSAVLTHSSWIMPGR